MKNWNKITEIIPVNLGAKYLTLDSEGEAEVLRLRTVITVRTKHEGDEETTESNEAYFYDKEGMRVDVTHWTYLPKLDE